MEKFITSLCVLSGREEEGIREWGKERGEEEEEEKKNQEKFSKLKKFFS